MEEEKRLPYDYRQCGAIWQRVAPELDPYPMGGETALSAAAEKRDAGQEAERLLQRMAERKGQYGLQSGRVSGAAAQRTLRELAAEEARAVHRLAAVYYVLSEKQWTGPKKCDLPLQPWRRAICRLLRQTEEDSRALRRLAEEMEATCLRRRLEQLAAEEQHRAEKLLRLLEGNGLA